MLLFASLLVASLLAWWSVGGLSIAGSVTWSDLLLATAQCVAIFALVLVPLLGRDVYSAVRSVR